MATIKEVVDGAEIEFKKLKDDYSQFRDLVISKTYVYASEISFPPIQNWLVIIRPSLGFKDRIARLGNRMEEFYSLDFMVVLKLDKKTTQQHFTKGLELIEGKFTHNTLDGIVQIVGNNVSYDMMDLTTTEFIGATVRYEARHIISIPTV